MSGSVIKRLELIKTAIALEDEEIIAMQVEQLTTGVIDEGVDAVLQALRMHRYDHAMLQIESYLKSNSDMVVYDDPELLGLRLELKVLEKRLQELDGRKNEYLHLICDFNTLYNLRLGALIEKILLVKKEIAETIRERKIRGIREMEARREALGRKVEKAKRKKKKLTKQLDDADDEEFDEILEELKHARKEHSQLKEEYKEEQRRFDKAEEEFGDESEEYRDADEEHEKFKETYKEVLEKNPFELDKDEQAELKSLYRKACKFCHPDIVADELKKQAEDIIKRLNDAYDRKDITEVEEIFLSLEKGTIFNVASDTIVDIDKLRNKIAQLRKMSENLEKEIEEIRNNEIHRVVREIGDWESYFNEISNQLQEELEKYEEILRDEKDRDEQVKVENNSDYPFFDFSDPGYEKAFDEYAKKYSEMNDSFDGDDDYWEEKF